MKKIFTSISALYKQNIISYYPKKEYVEMLYGTNTNKYKDKYKISLQKKETFEVGVIRIDDDYLYCPERLFVELNKFKMENTVKNEAIKNLKKIVLPEKVKKYYLKLKKHRRGLDNSFIETFLDKNLLNIEEHLKKSKDKKTIVREYFMAIISKKNIPVSIIKGGSAIELFTSIQRTTLDIDVHTNKNEIKSLINYLGDKNREIYFKLNFKDNSFNNLEKFFNKENTSFILKLSFLPISKGGVYKKELENIILPISFNATYNKKQIQDIIAFYGITRRNLKHLKNASAMVFTKEMLLAEKFQSIIAKPETSLRTKDLIDLNLLWDQQVNFDKFRKWLFRKWKNIRNSQEESEAKKIIEQNSSKPLTKIQENFIDAIKMYEVEYTYEQSMTIYKKLIDQALK